MKTETSYPLALRQLRKERGINQLIYDHGYFKLYRYRQDQKPREETTTTLRTVIEWLREYFTARDGQMLDLRVGDTALLEQLNQIKRKSK